MWQRQYAEYLLNLLQFLTDEEWENLEDRAYFKWLEDNPQPSIDVPESAMENFAAFDAWNQTIANDTASS